MRRGLRELAAARLLAEDTSGGGHRPRHALLGEAVAAGLLPGERAVLHERAARALAGDPALAAEVAGHWQAAGRPAEELPARVAAAEAAERVFGYAQAAVHLQRAIELGQAQPDAAAAAGIDVPRLSVRAIDAFYRAGDSVRAAWSPRRPTAGSPATPTPPPPRSSATAPRSSGTNDAPAAGLPLMEEALRLFEQAPPSFDHADALLDYANAFLLYLEERPEASHAALNRALEIAEAAGATAADPPHPVQDRAGAFLRRAGRGRVRRPGAGVGTRPGRPGWPGDWCGWPATKAMRCSSSGSSSAPPRWRRADLTTARQAGLQAWKVASYLAANASEALLALGRTAEAAALIDPLTTLPPDRANWNVQAARAEIDLLRGDTGAAAERWQLIYAAFPVVIIRGGFAFEVGAAGRGGLAVGGTPRRCSSRDPAGAGPVQGRGPDHFCRAAAGGGHAGLCRPGRAGPGAPRPAGRCRRRGRRRRPGRLGRTDGRRPVHRPPVRGHHPG